MFAIRVRLILLFVMCFAIPPQVVFAESIEWKKNLNILPPYCADRARGGAVGQKVPSRYAVLSDVWVHLHHYCAGLYADYKAKISLSQNEKKQLYAEVIGQMGYVSNHCKSRCALYPELHTRWGFALAETGQVGEAIRHYQLAIKSKPKYSPAYAGLSQLYLDNNQPEEARKILEQGRKENPKSRMLKRKLEELQAGKTI
jgi:tetratricopeptide (TPR) repeat protein